MRWPIETAHLQSAVSGSTTGATMTEFRLVKAAHPEYDLPNGGIPTLAFRGLRLGESSDRPCALSFTASGFSGSAGDRSEAPTLPSRTCASGSVGDSKEALLPVGTVVKGVQVCTNDSGSTSRVKGVRLFGLTFDSAGKAHTGQTATLERNNCKKWLPPTGCPASEVVTAFRTFFKDDALTAIGIECRPVYTQETMPKDYTLTMTSAPLVEYSPGVYRLTYSVKVKSNYDKALKITGLGIQPKRSLYSAFVCGGDVTTSSDLPAHGTVDLTVNANCKWDDLLAKVPGCSAGAECTVPLEFTLKITPDGTRPWNRPTAGDLETKVKRPIVFTKSTGVLKR